MFSRRDFLTGAGTLAALPLLPRIGRAETALRRLAMPPLVDATGTGSFALNAQAGITNFIGRADSMTRGFNQSFLGPVLRLRNTGETRADLPFMFHCHILEHEDGGMMGQFAVA
ncbi:multicopper oxidase domain-containing protein [Thioclava sp. A2]|uniref:multicopper oxidase domain-containing protein n=1 Tax=Thioclava sp. FCG-A2 TaxID=3080562 RepID=UPI00295580D6|nr:multicopper oxidase domain-containing protein [Thioclava sp. A2]MDV7272319.1 multicopper oxidase domain-containing protein [Thioclava sp. A2]